MVKYICQSDSGARFVGQPQAQAITNRINLWTNESRIVGLTPAHHFGKCVLVVLSNDAGLVRV